MKRNDTAGDFCMLYIEPLDDKSALFEAIRGQQKPVVLMLPGQLKTRIFQRPEDYADLKHLKRKFNIAIIFVTAGNEHLRQLATRHGFPAYLSIEALSRAVALGQVSLSHQRTLAKTGPLSPPVPSTQGRSIGAGRDESAPTPLQGSQSWGRSIGAGRDESAPTPSHNRASPSHPSQVTSRKTVPLSPVADSAFNLSSPPGTFPSWPTQERRQAQPLPPANIKVRRRRTPVTLTILLLLVLAGAGAGSFMVFFHTLPTTDPPTLQVVGYLNFISSGQLAADSSQGIDDQVQLDLHHLPQPAPGKSYYAWLLGDENRSDLQSILLGKLVVDAGSAHLFYKGDAQHTNLLAICSRFLITEEDDWPMPITPSPDYSAWRYYGAFPQTPDPHDKDHASFLDHLRYLLASDPLLNDMQLPGGLNNWFYRNTSQLLALAISARNTWEESKDINAVRNQAITILSYLDGLSFLQQDMPATTPMPALSPLAAVGLLDMNRPDQSPDSYLSSIVYHLNGLVNAPGSPPALRVNIATILKAISDVRAWLQALHDEARHIITMTNDQLGQPASLTILNDMVDQAGYAYSGQADALATGRVKEGATWIHDALQALATLAVTTYSAGSSIPEIAPGSRPVAEHPSRSEGNR